MGRPKKDTDLDVMGKELAVEGQVNVATLAKNEFPDEYTLDVIADYDPSADIFRIPNKDPRYAYRFLRTEEKNISIKTGALLYQKGGWQITPKAHLLRIGIKESFISADGSYRIGEHVLAFMPKELFDKKEAAKTNKTKMRTKQIERLLKDGDPSIGGKDMHSSMKGILPGHKLGMASKMED